LHHIMIRGIERRNIFRNDKDREDFLNRLSILLPGTKTSCYAWALLTNHAHFLFKTGQVPLATVMRRLLTGYVVALVAVGPALSGGPPHRSQRAGLPHWAPTLGVWRRNARRVVDACSWAEGSTYRQLVRRISS